MKSYTKQHSIFLSLGLALVLLAVSVVSATAQNFVVGIVDSEGNVGQYSSIAVDVDGRPHISYYDATNGDLKYAKREQDGTWTIERPDESGDVGLYTSIALLDSQFPRISYYRKDYEQLKVALFDGYLWDIPVPLDVRIALCEATSLALVRGNPIITYIDADTQALRLAMYDIYGSQWATETEFVGWTHLAEDLSMGISRKLGNYGAPRIAWMEHDQLWYFSKTCTATDCLDMTDPWHPTGSGDWGTPDPVHDSDPQSGWIESICLALDEDDDIAYIVYVDWALKCAIQNGQGWEIKVIDDSSDLWHSHCSIALHGNDLHICYSTSEELKYVSREGGLWTEPVSVDGGGVGKYNSITVDSEGNPHISYYDEVKGYLKYAYIRTGPAVDIMLVLDLSGSMLSPACPLGCDPKRFVLADAMELFGQVWKEIAVPDDRVGAIYFKTQVTGYDDGALVPVNAGAGPNMNDIIDDLQLKVTEIASGDLTAMGGGLQMAINKLENETGPRHIILFTDGMQNVNPMVVGAVDELRIANSNATSRQSNIDPEVPPTELNPDLGIKINTIGIGAPDSYMSRLNDIAEATGGEPKLTTAPDSDLRRFFLEHLIWVLQERSPQLVDYRHGYLPYSGSEFAETTEAFTINSSAEKVLLKLSWRRGESFDFHVWKDGLDLTNEGKIITGTFYKIYVVDVPLSVGGQVVNPGGDWSMEISGDAGASFEAAAIVDEPALKYSSNLDQPAYATGDPIKLDVEVSVGDQPLSGAQVTAEIIRPMQSMGTFLSMMPSLAPPPDFMPEPNTSPGQAKLEMLQRYFNVSEWLQPRSTTLDLYELDEGAYSSDPFTETTIPGSYKVIVHISGEHPDIGPFHRTKTLCTMVLFGKADRDASDLRVSDVEVIPSGLNLRLYVRPVDRFGNSLGPDYPDHIQVSLSVGEVQDPTQDNADGSYTIPLWIPEETDPQIRIDIKGNTVYGGLLSKLDSSDAF